jgi:hypothetical protein
MRCEHRAWRFVAISVSLAAACGSSDDPAEPAPVVNAIEPACGDSSTATPVTIRGALPAKVVISISDPDRSELDTTHRAWVGGVELTDVTWTSASELKAVVPPGIAAGTYGVTVQGPSGKKITREAAFEVRQGLCPVPTAALVILDPLASPATTVVGQELTVTATVQNNGQAAALGVTASIVSAPAGLTLLHGPEAPQDVPPGQARTFTWTYATSAAGGGVFVVEAAGTAADTGRPAAAPRVNTNAILVNPGAFLTANTVVVPMRATVGQLITVALTATNHATTAVLVTPEIVVSGPVTGGAVPAPLSIPAGSAQPFQWTFTANAPGTGTFTASVSGTAPGTGNLVTVPTAEASVTVQSAPALSATVSIPSSIELGDFTVTMLVSNGGGPSAADVDDVVPDPPTVQAGSTAAVTLKSGPSGSPAVVAVSQPPAAFTWTFTATAPGSLVLTSTARGRDANSRTAVVSAAASSNPASVGLHTVGGTVIGLAGTGLVLRNGSENLAVAGNGPYTFTTRVRTGGGYDVTVAAQPTGPSQTCAVTNGTGTMGTANVTDVSVTCSTNTFTVGGAISGLDGHGLVLQNGTEILPIPAGARSYAFQAPVASGASYEVTATAQPTGPSETCTVANGSGIVGNANVTNVNVTCSKKTFTVGGTVAGLAGVGLVLHNGTEDLPIGANGPFTFTAPVASGGTYDVTVTSQPGGPSQSCTVTSGSGTIGNGNVTTVGVTCSTNAFSVGGAISGLDGHGLVLQNGTESVTISPGATSYVFPTAVASGASYDVTVLAQPTGPSETCTVANGRGIVGGANITNVDVACSRRTFTVGVTVTGLAGTGLELHNGSDNLAIPANGSYTFPTPVASGATYDVTVVTQPSGPSQTCSVTNRSGTVGNANVTDVTVTCSTNAFTVGGIVIGLVGQGLGLHNGSDLRPVTGNGPFTFPTPVASGATYDVTVVTQPSDPSQSCIVTNGNGTVNDANVTTVVVDCTS